METSPPPTADLADLATVWTDIVQKWVGPALFIIIGCYSLRFLFGSCEWNILESHRWSKFISFLALGVVVAVVIYVAPHMFGQNSGLVQDVGKVAEKAGNVNN